MKTQVTHLLTAQNVPHFQSRKRRRTRIQRHSYCWWKRVICPQIMPIPAGVCRQVMMEFCDPKTFRVITAISEDTYLDKNIGRNAAPLVLKSFQSLGVIYGMDWIIFDYRRWRGILHDSGVHGKRKKRKAQYRQHLIQDYAGMRLRNILKNS